MCFSSKQSSLFSYYALPTGGKSKDAVVHYRGGDKFWQEKSRPSRRQFWSVKVSLVQDKAK